MVFFQRILERDLEKERVISLSDICHFFMGKAMVMRRSDRTSQRETGGSLSERLDAMKPGEALHNPGEGQPDSQYREGLIDNPSSDEEKNPFEGQDDTHLTQPWGLNHFPKQMAHSGAKKDDSSSLDNNNAALAAIMKTQEAQE